MKTGTAVGAAIDIEAVIRRAVVNAFGRRYGRAERELAIAACGIELRGIFFGYGHRLAILRQRGNHALDISVLD